MKKERKFFFFFSFVVHLFENKYEEFSEISKTLKFTSFPSLQILNFFYQRFLGRFSESYDKLSREVFE